jgi:hypothetical protein
MVMARDLIVILNAPAEQAATFFSSHFFGCGHRFSPFAGEMLPLTGKLSANR